MIYWIVVYSYLVLVCAQQDNNDLNDCSKVYCTGEEYECIGNQCYCASGYIPNYFQTRCIKCPGLNEKCFGPCCNKYGNGSLHCWQGVCRICHDQFGNWICRDSLDQVLLISTTQVIMASALILGIIATFILLYKLCAVVNLRPLGRGSDYSTRLSIGSLQLYVEERLRDAPPRYSRNAPAGSSTYPAGGAYMNNGFVHDSSVPPPAYSPAELKTEDNNNTTIHI